MTTTDPRTEEIRTYLADIQAETSTRRQVECLVTWVREQPDLIAYLLDRNKAERQLLGDVQAEYAKAAASWDQQRALLTAERDRLRVVAEKARDLKALHREYVDEFVAPAETGTEQFAKWSARRDQLLDLRRETADRLDAALDALDGGQ